MSFTHYDIGFGCYFPAENLFEIYNHDFDPLMDQETRDEVVMAWCRDLTNNKKKVSYTVEPSFISHKQGYVKLISHDQEIEDNKNNNEIMLFIGIHLGTIKKEFMDHFIIGQNNTEQLWALYCEITKDIKDDRDPSFEHLKNECECCS